MTNGNPLHQNLIAHPAPADTVGAPVFDRAGLSSDEAEELLKVHGYNELPVIEISLFQVLIRQFMGTMPYMLEFACIIALAVGDYLDFGIIFVMLLCNGFLGFYEELKAAASLRELTEKMEQKIGVVRDGAAIYMNTRFLVPGDIILITGGSQVPADIDHIEGDVLEVDTAAITGEPIPRKYPGDHGVHIFAGCTIKAGEAYAVVRKTGLNTMVGSATEDIAKDKQETKVSVFEQRVLQVVKIIILLSLIDVFVIFLVQGLKYHEFNAKAINKLLLTCLSIIIASVPIALPLVLQVTMALGAGKMAREFNAVVTSLPALQDISSMTVLCSDKTGTLTTAKIDISPEDVYACGNFTQSDVALYAGLASNRDKKEDAIDRSVIKHFDKIMGGTEKAMAIEKQYTKVRGVGFNPIYKRVLFEFTHKELGRCTVVKGLPNKILDTADGGVDDAADQWKCEDLDTISETVKKIDYNFAKDGFKTLAVGLRIGNGPMKFVGILPMLDPPRHDSEMTIKCLTKAGINVKMITGDHLNIAKTTAKKIGMGINIHAGEATRVGTHDRDELILNADGFAQVLPKDKREVVLVLRKTFGKVVGMTGDGVNDAPALSAAQCGVAVDDATDAAKNAAAIVLTSPGLSAIYSGVVESRRIFRKLKSYVTYRFGATIQIVLVLTILILCSQCPIESLYVIILALFNDITMLPVAYDNQQASSLPENPDVNKLLILAGFLGVLETIFSLLFAYGADRTKLFDADMNVNTCSTQVQAGIWLQIFIAAELLIFSARAPSYMFTSIKPSLPLVVSVITGCIIASLLANQSSEFGKLHSRDIVFIWIFDIIGIIIIDILKVQVLKFFGENTEVLSDENPMLALGMGHHDRGSMPGGEDAVRVQALVDATSNTNRIEGDSFTRESMSTSKLTNWLSKSQASGTSGSNARASSFKTSRDVGRISTTAYNNSTFNSGSSRLSVTSQVAGGYGDSVLRGSVAGGISIRPNTPANKRGRM